MSGEARDPVAAYFEAASKMLDLPIRPEHRAAALAAFRVLAEQAALVTAFALPADIGPAPRFAP